MRTENPMSFYHCLSISLFTSRNLIFCWFSCSEAHLDSTESPFFRGIYNIVDDDPAPREEVFTYAEDLIKKKWPGRTKCSSNSASSASLTKMDDSRGDKRVSNMRMKRELGVRLLHPSYRSGLLSIIDQMENPFHCSP